MSLPPNLFHADPIAHKGEIKLRKPKHFLRVHESIEDNLHDKNHLAKRFNLICQDLAARGRTNRVKGCRGNENQGWLRSPLGGNNGMQYYVWWTRSGSLPTHGLNADCANCIWVRAVRHHDDHKPLRVGVSESYYEPDQSDYDGEGDSSPWTEKQIGFVKNERSVRILYGEPGSGKTSALWKAVEARTNQRILYLTWSSELRERAKERFDSFAPHNVDVDSQDFTSFLGGICQHDVKKLTYKDIQEDFKKVLSKNQSTIGPWRNRDYALYAELRSMYIGRALPEIARGNNTPTTICLTNEEYRELRAGKGRDGIGQEAISAFLSIANKISQETLAAWFPDLAAAAAAFIGLHNGKIPEGYSELDRIVVDEIQDLTLLETAVIVELCRAVANKRGRAPWLLLAGDEGQTVRPSGFEWSRLNLLLSDHLIKADETFLEGNLRCPESIVQVIEEASKKYKHLNKGMRPRKQNATSVIPPVDSVDDSLSYVQINDSSEAEELLKKIVEIDDVEIVSLDSSGSDWHTSAVLTPEDVKGLDYQSVCILNPGRFLKRLEITNHGHGDATELEEQARRTDIDKLRVALSRATGTLTFIDVAPDDLEQELSLSLLPDVIQFEPEELIELLAKADITPEERIFRRADDAVTLADTAPAEAWRRICELVRIVSGPASPETVSADSNVQEFAWLKVLEVSARLLVENDSKVLLNDLLEKGRTATEALAKHGLSETFNLLCEWGSDRRLTPFALLNSAADMGISADWVTKALRPVSQDLRTILENLAKSPDEAQHFVGDIETWLELISYQGNIAGKAAELREIAANALLDNNLRKEAQRVLMSKVQRERDISQQNYQETIETLEGMRQTLRDTQEEKDWLKKKQEELEQGLISRDLEVVDLAQALEEAKEKRNKVEGELDELQRSLLSERENVEALELSLGERLRDSERLNREKDNLRRDNQNAQNETVKLCQDLENRGHALDKLKRQKAQTRHAFEAEQDKTKILSQQLQTLSAERETLRQERDESRRELQTSLERAETLVLALTEHREGKERLMLERNEARQEQQAILQEMTDLRQSRDPVRTERDKLRQERDEAQKTLQSVQIGFQSLFRYHSENFHAKGE